MRAAEEIPVKEGYDARRNLYIFFLSLLLWGLGESMFYIFQPLYLEELGADPLLIGGVLSSASLVMGLGHIPFGLLGDRIGRRPIIWGSWVLGLLATLIMALARSLGWYVGGLLFFALTVCAVPSMSAYIANSRGRWTAGRALTFTFAGFNAGALLGPVLGGYLAELIGLRGVYFVASGIFLVSSVLIFLLKDQPVEAKPEGHALWAPLANRKFVVMLAFFFFFIFAFILPQTLTPNFLQNQHGLSFSQVGQLAALFSLSAFVLNLSLGQLRPGLVYSLAGISLMAFNLLLLRGQGILVFSLAYLILGVSRVGSTMSSAIMRPLVHPAQMGLAFGCLETVKSLAMSLAPLVAGLLYARDPKWIYWVALAAAAIMLVVILFNQRHLDLAAADS